MNYTTVQHWHQYNYTHIRPISTHHIHHNATARAQTPVHTHVHKIPASYPQPHKLHTTQVHLSHHGHLNTRGVDHGGVGGANPMKICRSGQRIFWPSKLSHSFIQNYCWMTTSFHVMKDERCVSKMEGNANFSRRLKQFDVIDPDPFILRQVYDTAQHCDTSNKYTPYHPLAHITRIPPAWSSQQHGCRSWRGWSPDLPGKYVGGS